ncbi:hypothetical protein H9636_18390 [Ureibacillus sp. Re31]|uniref:Uncharacterized protein n=1 Tax=Ureibacillus galli TaxID=2762222 RepID=A0ABR8XH90_9BACL|nr:hypothetical protein [Ureibacillus galli]MBD8028607.1 hypothetical protein [Ureibacillus galli]
MIDITEKLRKETGQLKAQLQADGYYGEEYDRLKAQLPVPNPELAYGCICMLNKAYEVLLAYITACNNVQRALPLDVKTFEQYESYAEIAWRYFSVNSSSDIGVNGFAYAMALHYAKKLASGKAGYHTTIGNLISAIDRIDVKRFSGEVPADLDDQVERYFTEYNRVQAQIEELAERNRKEMATYE